MDATKPAGGIKIWVQTIVHYMEMYSDRLINKKLAWLPAAYAVSYLRGTIGCGLILSAFGPKLLGVDLKEECEPYEKEMSGGKTRHKRLDRAAPSLLASSALYAKDAGVPGTDFSGAFLGGSGLWCDGFISGK